SCGSGKAPGPTGRPAPGCLGRRTADHGGRRNGRTPRSSPRRRPRRTGRATRRRGRTSDRAAHAQIADLLRDRIRDKTYAPGSVLPSEDRLAEELGVSRVTINKAIGLLRASGDVKVRRGVGTVVRSLPRIDRDAVARYAARNEGTGAGEVEVRKLGYRSRTDYLEIGPVIPPAAVAKTLGLGKGKALVRRRVLYAND